MNMSIEIELFEKVKPSSDPRKPSKTSYNSLGTFTANVTNLTSAYSYRAYGQLMYGLKVIRTATPLPQFDLVTIDGKDYVEQERSEVGNRQSITIKEGG